MPPTSPSPNLGGSGNLSIHSSSLDELNQLNKLSLRPLCPRLPSGEPGVDGAVDGLESCLCLADAAASEETSDSPRMAGSKAHPRPPGLSALECSRRRESPGEDLEASAGGVGSGGSGNVGLDDGGVRAASGLLASVRFAFDDVLGGVTLSTVSSSTARFATGGVRLLLGAGISSSSPSLSLQSKNGLLSLTFLLSSAASASALPRSASSPALDGTPRPPAAFPPALSFSLSTAPPSGTGTSAGPSPGIGPALTIARLPSSASSAFPRWYRFVPADDVLTADVTVLLRPGRRVCGSAPKGERCGELAGTGKAARIWVGEDGGDMERVGGLGGERGLLLVALVLRASGRRAGSMGGTGGGLSARK